MSKTDKIRQRKRDRMIRDLNRFIDRHLNNMTVGWPLRADPIGTRTNKSDDRQILALSLARAC